MKRREVDQIVRSVMATGRYPTRRAMRRIAAEPAKDAPAPKGKPFKVSEMDLAKSRAAGRQRGRRDEKASAKRTFSIPAPPPGVAPKESVIAMDSAFNANLAWAAGTAISGSFFEGQAFLGYPYLAELAQRPEYRRASETIATQMTRKWIKLQAAGGEDKTEKLKELEKELERLKVRDMFREAAEQDGFFGRSHIYLDVCDADDRDELVTPIGDGNNDISLAKIKKGQLKRIKSIEAMWCYPNQYNSNDPLKADWYKPQQWFVNGKAMHASRLLTFIGREVPDLLKPAYSFGGLSLSQMGKPYVDNWLQTRQSVSDLIDSFSVSGININLPEQLNAGNVEGGGSDTSVFDRVEFFNNLKNNRGTMVLGVDEEFFNVSTPLGTLDVLQAQAQEHMSSVWAIPLIFYLGISPTGLNASSEGEIRTFYDWIHSYQELLFRENLRRVIGFAQINIWGAVDPAITFIFEPLWSLDEKGLAEVREIEARTDAILINDCHAISAHESRQRVAADPDTPYAALDVDDDPPPPLGETEQPVIPGSKPPAAERNSGVEDPKADQDQ